MRGSSKWHSRPFMPIGRRAEAMLPYICRIAPKRNGVEIDWFDNGADCPHEIYYKRLLSDTPYHILPAKEHRIHIDNLCEEQDYEFFISRSGQEGKSMVRIFRTGYVPGDSIVNYLHPLDTAYDFSGQALCSPSIAVLPSGRLIVSMDVYAKHKPQNLTLLFISEDRGRTWNYLNDLFPCYWGKLFVYNGRLYMLALSTEYGDILIGASDDEGLTWTAPTPIFRGSGMYCSSGPHKAPLPIIYHKGKLFTAIDYGCWEEGGHASGMLSIDADADLLNAENWTLSDSFLPHNSQWPGAAKGGARGALEGNMVVSPNGELINMLRYNIKGAYPDTGLAVQLLADADHPEKELTFLRIVEMNGGSNSKFMLQQDPVSRKYVAICSLHTPGMPANMRNVLGLVVSDDLISWKVATILLDYRHLDNKMVGFQYCDFVFDGDDILYVCRTAFNRPRNFHDANYITFHTIPNFRRFL